MDDTFSILVVDDDSAIRELLTAYLKRSGHRVRAVADAAGLKELMNTQTFDVIILDVMLPDEDGFSLCAYCRARSTVAIIMLTAKGEANDKIQGLELGADDYLAKPFVPEELLARIRSVMRRKPSMASIEPNDSNWYYSFAGWQLQPNTRQLLSPDGIVIPLSHNEFKLLNLFLERPQRILNRDFLMQRLKSREQMPFDRAIDMQISRLRLKLQSKMNESPEMIKTIRGEGYSFVVPVSRETS